MNRIFIIGWRRQNVNAIDLTIDAQFTTPNPFDPPNIFSANQATTLPLADPVSNDAVLAGMRAAFPLATVELMPAPVVEAPPVADPVVAP